MSGFELDSDRNELWFYADLAEPGLPTVDQVHDMALDFFKDEELDVEITQVAESGGYPGEFYIEYETGSEPDYEAIVEARRERDAEAIAYRGDKRH
jgi:hypothetical protein